jgi:uncharacterized protein YhhL (DUF1145 family)
MSSGKIVLLVVYAVLAALAFTKAGTSTGTVVNWVILALVVVHSIEVMVFFKKCKAAGGSLPVHLLNVFAFGYLHVRSLQAPAS